VLAEHPIALSKQDSNHGTIQSRLRAQMQADALRPLSSVLDEDAPRESLTAKSIFTPETIEEATHFLRLGVRSVCILWPFKCAKAFYRPRTDCFWYLLIFATSICIVSGVGHSMTTRMRWMNNVLARKKMHMTNITGLLKRQQSSTLFLVPRYIG